MGLRLHQWRQAPNRPRSHGAHISRFALEGKRGSLDIHGPEVRLTAFAGVFAVRRAEAHRAIKIWRALWNVLDGFKLTNGQRDPSKSTPNHAPPPRSQLWREYGIACIAKRAWRDGYTGLATLLVILWDGMMRPVDARTVKVSQIITDGTGRALELVRAKSGQKAIAPLTHRAWRVITAYRLGRLEPDDSPMCRTREGSEYSKDVLSKDFRTIRQRVFPGDGRTMLDIRRTGASEAVAGTGDMKALPDAMGSSLPQNQALQKAYTPAQMATAMTIPEARRRGRRNISKNKN